MRRKTLRVLVTLIALAAVSTSGRAQLDPGSPSSYFDAMPLHESATPIRRLLGAIQSECTRIDKPCQAGAALLEYLFRGSYRDQLPDIVVQLVRDPETGRLRALQPVLIFNRHNTPYLYGVEHLGILVLSDAIVPLEARLTTIREREVNPFAGMFGVVGISTGQEAPVSESSVVSKEVRWRQLNQAEGEDPLFIGSAHVAIGADVVARATLIPKELEAVSFQSITAHLSNSRSSASAFSAALGITLDTEGTLLAEDGNPNFNGYVFAKFFLPGHRPRLQVSPASRRLYRSSIAVVTGTNLTNDAFQEIVVGFSFGHLIGKSGAIVAANWVRTAADTPDGGGDRRWRLLLGVDFTF